MIHVAQIGHGEKSCCLIHGWGLDSRVWQGFAEQLAQEYSVTLIDLPGFGLSTPLSEPITITSLSEAILPYIQPNSLCIGWSLGGLVANYCAQRPNSPIREMVHIASSPRFTADETWPGMSHDQLRVFADELTHDYHKTLTRFIHLQLYRAQQATDTVRSLCEQINNEPCLDTLKGCLSILLECDQREACRTQQQKSLYIYGKMDVIVPVRQRDALTRLNPSIQTHVIDNASHIPFLSHPSEVLASIKAFSHV